MPIGKVAQKAQSVQSSAEYNRAQGSWEKDHDEKQPQIIASNLFSNPEDALTCAKEVKELSDSNKNVKNQQIRFSVSFDRHENLSEEKRLEFTSKVMHEMGVREDNHQYAVISHSDKPHPHHHVEITRVGLDGKALSDSYTKNRLEVAIDKVEKEMGIDNHLAQTRRFVFDASTEKGYKVQKENFKKIKAVREKSKTLEEKKAFMQKQILKSLEEKKISNAKDLAKELDKKGISFKYTTNKEGNKVLGTSFEYEKLAVKGSQISIKASVLEKEFEKNRAQNQTQEKSQYSEIFEKKQEQKQNQGQNQQQPEKEKSEQKDEYSYFGKMEENRQEKQQEQKKSKGFGRG